MRSKNAQHDRYKGLDWKGLLVSLKDRYKDGKDREMETEWRDSQTRGPMGKDTRNTCMHEQLGDVSVRVRALQRAYTMCSCA